MIESEFDSIRTTFAIVEGRIIYGPKGCPGHRWLVEEGPFTEEEFKKIVRGYRFYNRICFYRGDFKTDDTVKITAARYVDKIDINGVDEIYLGLHKGVPGTVWSPIEVLSRYNRVEFASLRCQGNDMSNIVQHLHDKFYRCPISVITKDWRCEWGLSVLSQCLVRQEGESIRGTFDGYEKAIEGTDLYDVSFTRSDWVTLTPKLTYDDYADGFKDGKVFGFDEIISYRYSGESWTGKTLFTQYGEVAKTEYLHATREYLLENWDGVNPLCVQDVKTYFPYHRALWEIVGIKDGVIYKMGPSELKETFETTVPPLIHKDLLPPSETLLKQFINKYGFTTKIESNGKYLAAFLIGKLYLSSKFSIDDFRTAYESVKGLAKEEHFMSAYANEIDAKFQQVIRQSYWSKPIPRILTSKILDIRRATGNKTPNTFDFIDIILSYPSTVPKPEMKKHIQDNFKDYVDEALKLLESNKRYTKYGVPTNYLKVGKAVITAQCELLITFELKQS